MAFMNPSIALGASQPWSPPLYLSSVYHHADLDSLERIHQAGEPGFVYARDNHPNAEGLERTLAEWEAASWAVVTSSGMSALTLACLASASAGDRILASDQLYGRTSQLLQELSRFHIVAEQVDTLQLAAVEQALKASDCPRATLLIVETLSNPLLRVADVPALAALCRRHECRLLVDNTFASPEIHRPLEWGAEWVMESLTKMISGHADVTLGLLAGRDDAQPRLRQIRSIWGLIGHPFECWLTQRSLPTLSLRMRAACANARALAAWLTQQPEVERVLHPSLPEHPDHDLADKLLEGAGGHMLAIELKGGRDAVNRFMQQAKGIPFCASLGDVYTTCSHPVTASHRYVPEAERQRLGITPGLLRLSIGIEPLAHLQAEMRKGWAGERG